MAVLKYKGKQIINFQGSPKNVKILDFQGLTLGHPGFDIWTMVYAATDPEYRAAHLESDLRAYYDIISTYLGTCPDFTQFMQELEQKRILGMTMFSKSHSMNLDTLL